MSEAVWHYAKLITVYCDQKDVEKIHALGYFVRTMSYLNGMFLAEVGSQYTVEEAIQAIGAVGD